MSTVSDNFAGDDAERYEMSRPFPISDATADFLLAGGEVDPTVQDLAQVLTAASAPGTARELHREGAAVAAFATAHLTKAPRRRFSGRMVMGALGVKLAAAALAAVAVGGIALAASTGVLPDPLHPAPPSVSTPDGPVRSSTLAESPTPSPQQSRPAQSFNGLCTAYLNSGSASEKNKNVTTDLAAAAGGIDKVEAYCVALVGSPKAKPSHGTTKSKPSASPKH